MTGIREGWLDEGEDIRAQLYGGSLIIRWQDGYPVYMTGPATFVYEGVFSPEGLMAGAGFSPEVAQQTLYQDHHDYDAEPDSVDYNPYRY